MISRKGPLLRIGSGIGPLGVALVVVVTLVVAVGIGALIGYYTSGGGFGGKIRKVFQPPFGGKRTVRILVLGEDNTGLEAKQRGLSDTLMLVSVDLDVKHVGALSIPRDTRVDLGSYGDMCKINAAHVHGGPMLTRLAVGELTGIQPDYYVKSNIEGFEELVDILGGVEIDVEKDMRYRDTRGGLYINLKKGPQLLDGDKAMQYVRFRHDAMGDLARIQRQQKFLKALAAKALSPAKLPKLPQTIQAMLENVETDLGPKDAVYLARFVSGLDLDEVKMDTLPGVPEDIHGISYWIPDREKTAQVVQKLFFPPPGMPTIQVLNGSGMDGAARQVADVFEQHGYDVTSVGNADLHDYASSEVISHGTDVQGLDRIAVIVNSYTIKHEDDPAAEADVVVIVGKDCMLIGSEG